MASLAEELPFEEVMRHFLTLECGYDRSADPREEIHKICASLDKKQASGDPKNQASATHLSGSLEDGDVGEAIGLCGGFLAKRDGGLCFCPGPDILWEPCDHKRFVDTGGGLLNGDFTDNTSSSEHVSSVLNSSETHARHTRLAHGWKLGDDDGDDSTTAGFRMVDFDPANGRANWEKISDDHPKLRLKKGTRVTTIGLDQKDPKRWFLEGESFLVKKYDFKAKRYHCEHEWAEGEDDDEEEGRSGGSGGGEGSQGSSRYTFAFSRRELSPVVRANAFFAAEFVGRRKREKQAALYDPNGPHPPPLDSQRADKSAAAVVPLLQMMCPNVEQFKERSSCCGSCRAAPAPPPHKPFPVCSKCRMASFCNAACMKAGWKAHKKLCTTRAQREEALGDALFGHSVTGFKPGRVDSLSLTAKYNKAVPLALDACGERVAGALLLVVCCVLVVQLAGKGTGLNEAVLVPAVKQACGMRVTTSDVAQVCDALGLREELDVARTAELADFQRVEKVLVELRAEAKKLWATFEALLKGRAAMLEKGARLAKAVAETQGDKGAALRHFLVFLSYEGLATGVRNRASTMAMVDIAAAGGQVEEVWVRWHMAHEGESNVRIQVASGEAVKDQVEATRNMARSQYLEEGV